MKPNDVKITAYSLSVLLGFGVFVYGLSMAWRPLGFIVGGLLVATGFLFAAYYHLRKDAKR